MRRVDWGPEIDWLCPEHGRWQEVIRKYANHRVRCTDGLERLADDRGVTSEAVHPLPVAQHSHPSIQTRIVIGQERPAVHRSDAEKKAEEVLRDSDQRYEFWTVAAIWKQSGRALGGAQHREGTSPLSPVPKIRE